MYTGLYFRGDTAIFERAILEDNGWSIFLAYNQIVKDSLIVGQYLENTYAHHREHNGVILYDGPWDLQRVDFIDFFHDKPHLRPFKSIGGFNKFMNVSQKLRFEPEPAQRIFHFASTENRELLPEVLDSPFTSTIKDLDGTLTGAGKGYLVPDTDVTSHPGCMPGQNGINFQGMVFCPPTSEIFTLIFPNSNAFEVVRNQLSSLLFLPTNWLTRFHDGSVNKKTLIVTDPNYESVPGYTIKLGKEGSPFPYIKSDKFGISTPPIQFVLSNGVRCKQRQAQIRNISRSQKIYKIGNSETTGFATVYGGNFLSSCH